ncbi:MAG TPA: hypothetical protein VM925_35595 [Labilithrix sp.]|nr:hypothetical protein [Labilithrix sp.]
MPSVRPASLLIVSGLAAFVACSVAEIPGGGGYTAPTADAGPLTCTAAPTKVEKVDIATLNACECKAGGKAHCVARSKMPDALSNQLALCDGQTGGCVPDTIIQSGGEPPPACKTSGADGRCLSLCVPNVEKYAEILTRGDDSSCAEDEKCIPCMRPDGSSSGICEIGRQGSCTDGGVVAPATGVSCPFTGTEMDVSQMPICAPGGRCVSEALLDLAITNEQTKTELKARLATCAIGYCVPEEYLKKYGQHKPAACKTFAGIEGRCFSTVFKDIDAQKDLLQRDVCSENERCIPCFNPADGSPSGACTTVSCDAPTTTPPTLKDCCMQQGQMRGKCFPRTDIPTEYQSRLSDYECDDTTELCVPSENVDLKSVPALCKPSTSPSSPTTGGNGVCVSNCIKFTILENIVLQQGSCRSDQTCIPCKHPQNGQPTGAPGCK